MFDPDQSFILACWCRRRDSNSHGLRHRPLKTACLPIPPRRHGVPSLLHLGMSFAFESASTAGLSGTEAGAGADVPGGVAGACDAGWVAITPLSSVACDEYQVSPRLVRKNTVATPAVIRLRKLAEPVGPNRLPEAPPPNAAPMAGPLPGGGSTEPT